MLALAGATFFVIPTTKQTQAQVGRVVSVCVNPTTGSVATPSATNTCPPNSTSQSFPASGLGVCVVPTGPSGFTVISPIMVNNQPLLSPPIPSNGVPSPSTKCLSSDDPPINIGDFKFFRSIPQYNPGGTNTTPGTNPGTTPNTNPKTPTGTNPGGSTTPPKQTQGDCEPGFHKVGSLLCIPNSPIGSNDSILGEKTIGGLAARIVKILLFFSGIVAVIMAIIGGYYVMTAGGNEAQATSGRKTLTNAIIGLAIIILSYIVIQAVISFVT